MGRQTFDTAVLLRFIAANLGDNDRYNKERAKGSGSMDFAVVNVSSNHLNAMRSIHAFNLSDFHGWFQQKVHVKLLPLTTGCLKR